jgi:hypothetical protein
MPMRSHLHQLFKVEQCQAYIHTLRWKDRPLQCPRCQSHHIGRWAHTNIALDANATGAMAASAPSMTSLLPSCTRASGRWPTGYLPLFCCVWRARLGALPGN